MTINTLPVVFEDTQIDIVIIGGERWLRGPQIAEALGYKKPPQAASDIYRRNSREFDSSTTMVVELPSSGGPQLTRLYNARGAALIALKANTPKAEAFRRWVLDVLEGLADETPVPVASGLPKGVANDLQVLFVSRKGNAALLRYLAMGLGSAEIAKLLDISADWVRRRRRMAEALGLTAPPPNLAALRHAPNFRRMLEARDAAR